ncbi:MAG: tetratricopeptide repeat protein [Thermoanaerobaculia bacterium]
MPDQNPFSPKIEDLKARVRLDPKSRLFLPLAEELRKAGRPDEAEAALRSGLEHHSSYLSAWISLGRCLIERGARREATTALMNALAIDPGNVVAARLLADNYLALGEKVEAIKKLKLVRALLPSDDSIEEAIASLERELGEAPPPAGSSASSRAEQEPVSEPPASEEQATGDASLPDHGEQPREGNGPAVPGADRSGPSAMQVAASQPFFLQGGEQDDDREEGPSIREDEREPAIEASSKSDSAFPFGRADRDEEVDGRTADKEPEPFEEHADDDLFGGSPPPESPGADQEDVVPAAAPIDSHTSTLTMADLYARQGHTEAARDIYLRILDRDPSNEEVRRKLDLLGDARPPEVSAPDEGRAEAVRKLESWLQKVGPR